MTKGDDPLFELRELADAGVRVLEGGAGDPEFDTEWSGPIAWDRDVETALKGSKEAAVFLFFSLLVMAANFDTAWWMAWLAGSLICAAVIAWQMFGYRVAVHNRRRWRAERGLSPKD